MNFEKKMALLKALKKEGITSAKALSEFTGDSKKLVNSNLSKQEMSVVVELAEQVGKTNPFFDWFMAEA